MLLLTATLVFALGGCGAVDGVGDPGGMAGGPAPLRGFGVEVVEGDATRHVPVTTGLFAGGRVEISGDGLTEGMTVGMPA